MVGRYRPGPYALIETPTPSLCGYRKHSPYSRRTRARAISRMQISSTSLVPFYLPFLSRAAVCTPSRKAAVCIEPKEAARPFSVPRFHISVLDVVVVLHSRTIFYAQKITYQTDTYKFKNNSRSKKI